MNQFLHGMIRATAETFDLPEPILEVGSYQVAGQETIADLRSLFRGKKYIGLDNRSGPGVDCVADVEDLPHPSGSVGSVIAVSTFEHVPRFWRAFEEISRVLRSDGALLVACPFYFYIHAFPNDYWRFTPAALELLLERFPTKILGWHGPSRRPINVWALAFRESCRPMTGEQFQQYQARLRSYCRQPLRWKKKVRYSIGRWLFGHRPFAPYLEQDHWECQCRNLAS
jgi:SAM-dependent methyltransferase